MSATDFLIKSSEDDEFENRYNLQFKLVSSSSLNILSSLDTLFT